MCGIAGLWGLHQKGHNQLCSEIGSMTNALVHRGPDDEGFFVNEVNGIALGFRRLAILDLSPMGSQPMFSISGRYVITFNGEIYNYKALKQQLEVLGHHFRGGSDTEIMLAAFEEWGLEVALKRFAGMFAFALWDRANRSLSLVRDRLGIKPLYYGRVNGTLVWASELKSVCRYPSFTPLVDRGALTLYIRHGYVPAPYTIYQDIVHLPPGHMVTIYSPSSDLPMSIPYWSASQLVTEGAANLFTCSEQEATDSLEQLLREIVREHMISDVPLGAFLSGGIDSSTVVALMQAQSSRPVKTFSIGFFEEQYDEAAYARAVAKHLGTDHTELYVTPNEAQAVIPSLSAMYDEPLGDSSQIPTFLVSQLARKHVTVSLSGDGGDELFGGYGQYCSFPSYWKRVEQIPLAIRQVIGRLIRPFAREEFEPYTGFLNSHRLNRALQENIGKFAYSVGATSSELFYYQLRSQCREPANVVVNAHEALTSFTDIGRYASLANVADQLMFLDLNTYLPSDILFKVDRASMAVSLESRVPLLDHRVVEFAWRLPLSMKIRNNQGKWILRQVLDRYVPRQLVERPKKGFGVPVGLWIRGPLREWAESLLDERRIEHEGFFAPRAVRAIWEAHLTGHQHRDDLLWSILMFQAWRDRWDL